MNAGAVRSRFKPGELDAAVEAFQMEATPALQQIPGFVDVQLWVDRETGDYLGLGVYETEEAQAAAGRVFAESLPELASHSEGPPPEREGYSLVASAATDVRAAIQRRVDALNSGDLEQVARDLAPDVVLRYTNREGAVYRGPQGVKEHYQSWRDAFPDFHVDVRQIVATGTAAFLVGEFSGTHTGTLGPPAGDVPAGNIAATGRKVAVEFGEFFKVDRGMISEIVTYSEFASVMMQLGLTPTQIHTVT